MVLARLVNDGKCQYEDELYIPTSSCLLPWTHLSFRRQRHSLLKDAGITLVAGALGIAAKLYMTAFNSLIVWDRHKLLDCVENRPLHTGLISVCNHVCAIDDPLTLAGMAPNSWMINSRKIRWATCATDRCFTNMMLSRLVELGKTLPITRGHGLYQKGMQMCLDRINDGDWLHIFPEGTRSTDGKLQPLKNGVARLVVDADTPPLVLPFYHDGMQNLMNRDAKSLHIGQRVHILVGDVISFDNLLAEHRRIGSERSVMYAAVTQHIEKRLHDLRANLLQRIDDKNDDDDDDKDDDEVCR